MPESTGIWWGRPPTGYGKTVVAASLAHRAASQWERVLFIVPFITLINQTVDRFRSAGVEDIGVIQQQHELTNPTAMVQVASVHTLSRRDMPPADLVMIDEVHRWYAKSYPDWIADPWKDIPVIGLSATPWTKGLGKHFGKLIVGGTTKDMIEQGHLSPFKVFAPSSPNLKGVRTVAGEYHEGDLSKVMNDAKLVADVVSTWLDRAEQRPTLVFAVDRAHARSLLADFLKAGVPAEYVDKDTPAYHRAAIGERLNAGLTKVVCNIECLTTGVDWDVRCIVLARPTKSETLFVQMVGRGLRTAQGKSHCLILDHSDNHIRLGFVTDIHHDELDTGIKKPAEAKPPEVLPKKCPKCAFMKKPGVVECPCCGCIAQRQNGAFSRPGELVELNGRKSSTNRPSVQFCRGVYAELRHYAAQRGYKPGWAFHKYQEMVHTKPAWDWRTDPTKPPSETTLNWIKSRQIAYAKARGG